MNEPPSTNIYFRVVDLAHPHYNRSGRAVNVSDEHDEYGRPVWIELELDDGERVRVSLAKIRRDLDRERRC